MPKLICLMPTYNKEFTLAQAIDSVMMQKCNFEYKLIILDDCSTDKSTQIAKDYQNKYPHKIDILRNTHNLGLLRSITNGYKLLKDAEYFCVLDADDWYTDANKFADAVTFLDKHKNYSMYMSNIILKQDDKEEKYYNGKYKKLDFDFSDRIAGKAIFMQTSGVIYRNLYFKHSNNTKFAQIFNLKYPESYRADGFRFEWYLQGGKAHFENKITAVYNYDTNGIWSGMSEAEQLLHNAKMMYSCAEFFTHVRSYYLYEARQAYTSALQKIKDNSDIIFIKNKDLILDLSLLLIQPPTTFTSKFLKFCVCLIPNKKLRRKYKKMIYG
ncbi:MAG: glycosyltransferase family 2 protein [Alphaproteobacteria bacterium]|nr:glycosyltransferase family 2 protein [Alphaproteobacteria bacterium]